jgi:hypothetical protein
MGSSSKRGFAQKTASQFFREGGGGYYLQLNNYDKSKTTMRSLKSSAV